MKTRRTNLTAPPTADDLVRRALRLRRRGEERRALLTLRQACHCNEGEGRLWALYGAQALRNGKHEIAWEAFQRAIWLYERTRCPARAEAIRSLLERSDWTSQAA